MMNTYYLLTLLGRAAGHGATLVTIHFFQAGSQGRDSSSKLREW